jgi:chromosomal replication initiation ATPase DnaA
LKQLNLDLQTTENIDPYSEENFLLLEENSAAFQFLGKFFEQANFSLAQFPSMILRGSKSSGKTHLVNIFAKKHGAEILKIKRNASKNLAVNFSENKFYIIDNIDEIMSETLLLHLINSASEAKAFLLLSTDVHQFRLKDLNSRIKNIFSLQIKEPNLKTIEMLLTNGFARKQIKVSGRIIKFIADNIARNYAAVSEAINLIETYCNEEKGSLTTQKVKELLLLKS